MNYKKFVAIAVCSLSLNSLHAYKEYADLKGALNRFLREITLSKAVIFGQNRSIENLLLVLPTCEPVLAHCRNVLCSGKLKKLFSTIGRLDEASEKSMYALSAMRLMRTLIIELFNASIKDIKFYHIQYVINVIQSDIISRARSAKSNATTPNNNTLKQDQLELFLGKFFNALRVALNIVRSEYAAHCGVFLEGAALRVKIPNDMISNGCDLIDVVELVGALSELAYGKTNDDRWILREKSQEGDVDVVAWKWSALEKSPYEVIFFDDNESQYSVALNVTETEGTIKQDIGKFRNEYERTVRIAETSGKMLTGLSVLGLAGTAGGEVVLSKSSQRFIKNHRKKLMTLTAAGGALSISGLALSYVLWKILPGSVPAV